MSTSQTRYPPLPGRYATWQEWATNYVAFNAGGTQIKQPNDPVPILLAHQLGSVGNIGGERAITDGMLMFDPVAGKIVYSISGEWKTLTTDVLLVNALRQLMDTLAVPTAQQTLILDNV